ncbi:MAG: glycosyltransferase, partial [Acidimicrobiales bacterium]
MFAGWLGEPHEPLDVWDEVDETGLPIRWVATTPWTDWGDRNNFDNPGVTACFEELLDQEEVDVVNFHSMQSFGVGLLHAAADRGLITVVTLHDFWWWCARQFLCDRSYRPCSLVVEAGRCPCQVDRPWLDQRSEVTMAALRRADRLVSVSQIAARVVAANGVDPSRLSVIENGIPEMIPDRRPPVAPVVPETGDIRRFTYAGGADQMKGSGVLREAVELLAHRGGWSLSWYSPEAPGVTALQLRHHQPFAPDALDDVLARTDVLVVPSVARETYSSLTREAIRSRVPVICSDSLGPEEVVSEGISGLVVPSNDSAALARAMSRLMDDQDLFDRLRSGCQAVELPTVHGQVGAYERLLETLVRRPFLTAPAASGRSVERVLFVVGIEGAPLRYRVRLPADGLRSLGIHVDVLHYRHPDISGLGDRADVVVVYRVPATAQVLHFIAGVKRRGISVLFDVDDLIFDPDLAEEIPALRTLSDEEARLWSEGVRRYRATMEECDASIGST